MDTKRLNHILDLFPEKKVLVFGDFFLDQYLVIDDALREVSIETGLGAHQVVGVRNSPGAAGVVTSNLSALDVQVAALGMIGVDGRGYDLKEGLIETGIDISPLIESPGILTPTYTKPMVMDLDGFEREIERLDIKNRTPLPASIEGTLIERLKDLIQDYDGIIIVDHVPEHNFGVITDRVRNEIASLARAYPKKFFIADSRKHMAYFDNVIVKCNLSEGLAAAQLSHADGAETDLAAACSKILYQRSQTPVIITLGSEGILVNENGTAKIIPAMPVEGPIDIVGAGDSTIAGITAALSAGAALQEAALIGNLVASITIQQIGKTGTATRGQIKERFKAYRRIVDIGGI
ncbi:MAG: PfkB family carbohydrate kinase [Anaerolineales bacterium]|nr:PfkB family carbohydrate kinase [Anaerolineales bacterium]